MWTDFYMAFANRLLQWDSHRGQLYEKIVAFSQGNELLHYLHFENAQMWSARNYEIDPFTVMGIFNRGTTAEHRHDLAVELAKIVDVKKAEPPREFHGIPHLDPRKSIYEGNNELWSLFLAAMKLEYSEDSSFATAWDSAIATRGNALGILSIGLFWAQPYKFMAVDKISAPYIEKTFGLSEPYEKCSGRDYLNYNKNLASLLEKEKPAPTFPQITFRAWQQTHE